MKRPRHWIPTTAVALMAWGVVSAAGAGPPNRPPPPPQRIDLATVSSTTTNSKQDDNLGLVTHSSEPQATSLESQENDKEENGWENAASSNEVVSQAAAEPSTKNNEEDVPKQKSNDAASQLLDSIFSFEDEPQESTETGDSSDNRTPTNTESSAEDNPATLTSTSTSLPAASNNDDSSQKEIVAPVSPRPDPPGRQSATANIPTPQYRQINPPPPGPNGWGPPPGQQTAVMPPPQKNTNPDSDNQDNTAQQQPQGPFRGPPPQQQQQQNFQPARPDPPAAYRGPPPPGRGPSSYTQQPPPGVKRPNPMLSQQQPPRRPIQQQRRQRGRQAPAWKRVWRTIEGGLDSLADLEDGVMGKASQIYASTVETASTAIQKTRRLPKSLQQQDDDLDHVSSVDPTVHFAKRPVPRKPPSRQNLQQAPTVNNFLAQHEARRQKQQQTVPTTTKSQNKQHVETKGVNWNDVARGKTGRPILANGGASALPPRNPNTNTGTTFQAPTTTDPLSTKQHQHQPPPIQALVPPATNPVDSGRRGDFNALLHNTGAPAPNNSNSNVPGQRKVTRPGLPPTRPTGKNDPPVRPKIYDDEDEKVSFGERLGGFLPRMPSFRLFRFRRDSYQDFSATMDAWNAEDGEKSKSRSFLGLWKKNPRQLSSSSPLSSRSGEKEAPFLTSTVSAFQERCNDDNSQTLLKPFEIMKSKRIGRKRAFLDLFALVMIIYSVREVIERAPQSLAQSGTELTEVALGMLSILEDGWFYHSVVSVALAWATNSLVYGKVAENLASSISNQVKREAQYGALFLRLFASSKTKDSVVQHVEEAASAQTLATVEAARLRTFTICLLGALIVMSLSFITPLALASWETLSKIASIPELHAWPPQWSILGESIQGILVQLIQYVKSALKLEFQSLSEQPLQVAYDMSIIAVMFLVSSLPKMELLRKVKPAISEREEENAELAEAHSKQSGVISNLGGSSASRLQLASTRHAMDELLESWRATSLSAQAIPGSKDSIEPLIRMVAYSGFSGLLLVVPMVMYAKAGIVRNVGPNTNLIRWDSLWEVGLVLIYTQSLFLSAIGKSIDTSHVKKSIVQFLSNFKAAAKERTMQLRSAPVNLQLQASISPTTGLTVNDLWAAHAVRRAWAVRGASIACQNGEVVVVLGDDASGKSRLLTTLGEAMLSPPKQAQTATRVRGSIALGGLDISKWDHNQLRKRVGLVLNDVRTAADLSESLSGQTLEEILEPSDGLQSKDLSRSVSSSTRACMVLALKMTGLYSSLLPRLPSKLATVVTAKEDDLRPTALNPHSSILSPPEWTKLLVARVLCQTIFDNDNSASTTDRLEKSLLGSLLLLDDVTAHLSESEEGRFIRNLRLSGAASILTSTRWAMGRWADRIVVLKDGAVVESGTHSELLGRGPQQSLYAAKWHEMTSA